MKKSFVKVLCLLAVSLVISGGAFAWDDTQHIKVAPNGKGDLVIYPFYFAAPGGWETKLTLVNTSQTYSVVAKLILRSHYYSQELLDFLIYLTPADVWTGSLRNDGQGVYLYSDDNSMKVSGTTFASPENPVRKTIANPVCSGVEPFDSNDWGYIEVVEAWYGDVSLSYYTGDLDTQEDERSDRPVTKAYLARIYDTWEATSGLANAPAGGRAPGQPRPINPASVDRTINVLAGHFEFQNRIISGMTSGMNATVFADFDTQDALDAQRVSGIQAIGSRNTLGEIEAAMAKSSLAMDYVNDATTGDYTVHLLTFPTKISIYEDTVGDENFCDYINGTGDFWEDQLVTSGTNDFASREYRCLAYGRRAFDTEENSLESDDPFSGPGGLPNSLCEEVNLITVDQFVGLFNEGWVNYTFSSLNRRNPTPFAPRSNPLIRYTYAGTPVLASNLMFTNGGLKLFNAAYTNGNVFDEAGNRLYSYQYYNEIDSLGQDVIY